MSGADPPIFTSGATHLPINTKTILLHAAVDNLKMHRGAMELSKCCLHKEVEEHRCKGFIIRIIQMKKRVH